MLGKAWKTTYLSAGLTFQRELPGVLAKVVALARQAERAQMRDVFPPGLELRPRCVEFHEMSEGGALADAKHYDSGSVLTIDVLLADPRVDFEGGDLRFPGSEGAATYLERPGDCVVFASHKYHRVERVRSGTRRVMIIELWEGPERSCPHRCECAKAPCPFDLDRQRPSRKFSWPPRKLSASRLVPLW